MSKPVTLVIEETPIMKPLVRKECGKHCKIFSVKSIKDAFPILHSKKIEMVLLVNGAEKDRIAFARFLRKEFPKIAFMDMMNYLKNKILEKMDEQYNNSLGIGYKELKFKEFLIVLAWDRNDKIPSIIAKSIIKMTKMHKEKIEEFLTKLGIKRELAYVLAYEKKEALKRGYVKRGDWRPIMGNTIFFKNADHTRTNIVLSSKGLNLSYSRVRKMVEYTTFMVFFHELLHAVCSIINERNVMNLTEVFCKSLPKEEFLKEFD